MELLSGNEAIAQGAWEAGAHVGVGYPGTPSTETMEAFAKKEGVYAEWCNNEKVALEVGVGASAGGARVLATMKHVGVNVAADPLFTSAYTGVKGGLVVLCADDPGMHSSQNEQDSRFYAQAARIPMFEPSDSSEAYAFTKAAYTLSERFDIPFLIRSTVRISHAKSPVETGERIEAPITAYEKNAPKWVTLPGFAKQRRLDLDSREDALAAWADECEFNQEFINGKSTGIITSGASYQYVRDALPEASILKLGVVWPLPEKRIREFAEKVRRVYVVEEASTYLSTQVKALGITVSKPPCEPLPRAGELSPSSIGVSFCRDLPDARDPETDIPNRPPALCAGCPHRLVFKELARQKCIITGDIGCYTLGALPPLSAMDSCLCMGGSVSMAHGMELALAGQEHGPIVGIIGDSTFAHSGYSSLLNTAYNYGSGTICILDNRTTGMTGHQGNPFNGITLQGRPSRELGLEGMIRALGIEDIQTVNPNDMTAVREAIKGAISRTDELSVIVFRSPCVLLKGSFVRKAPYSVSGSCRACGVCIQLGCPAIRKNEDGTASIDYEQCVGCGQCASYCNFGCITQE